MQHGKSPKAVEPIPHDTPLPKTWRVLTMPRGLYSVHRAVLGSMDVLALAYGMVIMAIGWFFKIVGFVFVVEPSEPAESSGSGY